MHHMVTGHPAIGMLHFLSKTSNAWHSEKQGTVKMATCGSRMVAVHTCGELIDEGMMHELPNLESDCLVVEAIIRGFISYTHIPGAENPADILSKHWGYSQVYPLLRPILFFRGDAANCVLEVVKDHEDDNTRS